MFLLLCIIGIVVGVLAGMLYVLAHYESYPVSDCSVTPISIATCTEDCKRENMSYNDLVYFQYKDTCQCWCKKTDTINALLWVQSCYLIEDW